MPTLAERDKARREQEAARRTPWHAKTGSHANANAGMDTGRGSASGTMINLPPLTKAMAGIFIALHVLVHVLLPADVSFWIISNFGFVSGIYTGEIPFSWTALVAPFTYILLHGSWMHLILNTVMLMAFGAGVERWMGSRRMGLFFVLCSLIAIGLQFAVEPFSTNPVIGASGGLSGLFAAALVMLQRNGSLSGVSGRYGLLPLILFWILVSVLFGMIGSPSGESVAWIAHIGGFIAGFALLKLMRWA